MHRIHYSVPMVRQQFSPVCWLASALMILQYRRGYTMTTEELAQQAGLQGPDFRAPGLTVASEYPSGPEQHAALSRIGFTGRRFDAVRAAATRDNEQEARLAHAQAQGRPRGTMARPLRPRMATGPAVRPGPAPGEQVIFRVLDRHGPFVLMHNVGSFSYGPGLTVSPQALGSGHAVCVTGFDPAHNRVLFNNPWGQQDVPTTSASITGAMQRWESTPANKSIYWL